MAVSLYRVVTAIYYALEQVQKSNHITYIAVRVEKRKAEVKVARKRKMRENYRKPPYRNSGERTTIAGNQGRFFFGLQRALACCNISR